MRVGRRLFVAVIPAVLGVLAMAALAYWGQRGRQVPEGLPWVGLLAAVVSLGLAWRNTRYVARRLEALAARGAGHGPARDEIDAIERSADHAEAAGHERAAAAEARAAEYAAMLLEITHATAKALDEVRLPLHILLETRFGDLNENQEEMIAAAYAAAQAADEHVRTLARVVQIDNGSVQPELQPIRLRDVVSPLLPAASARASAAGAELSADLSPALPHAYVDARLAREALSLILDWATSAPEAGSHIQMTAAEDGEGSVEIRFSGCSLPDGAPLDLARRLLAVQGGRLEPQGRDFRVRFPRVPADGGTRGSSGLGIIPSRLNAGATSTD